jgi:hypothetical protein
LNRPDSVGVSCVLACNIYTYVGRSYGAHEEVTLRSEGHTPSSLL